MKTKRLSLLLLPLLVLASCQGESTSGSTSTSVPPSSGETSTSGSSTSEEPSTSVDHEEVLKEKINAIVAESNDNFTFKGAVIKFLQTANYTVTSVNIHITLSTETIDFGFTGGSIKLSADNNWYAFTLDSLDTPTELTVEPGALSSEPTKIELASFLDLTQYTYNVNTNEFDYVIDYDSIDTSIMTFIEQLQDLSSLLYKISAGIDENEQLYVKLWSKTSSFDTLRFTDVGTSKVEILDTYSATGPVPEYTVDLAAGLAESFGSNNYSVSTNITETIYSSKITYGLGVSESEVSYSSEVKSDDIYYYVQKTMTSSGTSSKDLYENADPTGYGNYHNDGTAWSQLTSISSTQTWQEAINTMKNVTTLTDDNFSTFLNTTFQRQYLKSYSLKEDVGTSNEYLNQFLALLDEASQYEGEISSSNLTSLSIQYENLSILSMMGVRIQLEGERDSKYVATTISLTFSAFNSTTNNKEEILATI